ncbi:hypothetical protein CHS0354_020859 [Potamilus streckersoni]|uniref:Uncharacterized protein n=1 Tax=Potamilus streckersoni TaxID=2493646 RepID=A0AAE0VVN0_9BIVA|nr:hypothetical protein CHS0354_020859 [Potamilus streckersoni]
MEFVTTMFAFFMLFGIVHAKEREPKIYARGANATIHIEELEIDEKNTLEITFSGFISKQHVTNVMLYAPMKNQRDNISINTIYKGRIEMIKIEKSSLRFLLLNVDFVDSGNYTVAIDSQRKGATSIFVPRHRLLGNNTESMVVHFTCNITYLSSIKIEMMISKQNFYVLKYDVKRRNCTEEGNLYRNRIENCVLKGSNFSFTIRKITFVDMGMYVAWDDKDILMDSVIVEFEGNNTASNPGKRNTNFSSLLIPNLSGSGEEPCK